MTETVPTIRRRPGRPRIPGRLTVDTKTGQMGIFVMECQACRHPALLPPRDFDVMAKRGIKQQKSFVFRLVMHMLAVRNI